MLFGFSCKTLIFCEGKSKIADHSRSLFRIVTAIANLSHRSLKKRDRPKSDESDSLLGIKIGKTVKNSFKKLFKQIAGF